MEERYHKYHSDEDESAPYLLPPSIKKRMTKVLLNKEQQPEWAHPIPLAKDIKRQSWRRKGKHAHDINPDTEDLHCMQYDIQYHIVNPQYEPNWTKWNPVDDIVAPAYRLIGLMRDNVTRMAVNVYGYEATFYIQIPNYKTHVLPACGGDDASVARWAEDDARLVLDDMLGRHWTLTKPDKQHVVCNTYVKHVRIVQKNTVMLYQPDLQPFLAITCTLPEHVPMLRGLLEKHGLMFPGHDYPSVGDDLITYESNLDPLLAGMMAMKLVGTSWITLPKTKYHIRRPHQKTTHCDVECDVYMKDVMAHEAEGEWQTPSALRILSFDIECFSPNGGFPTPNTAQCIQIGNTVRAYGAKDDEMKTLFVLGETSAIADVDVRCFANERDLLIAWQNYINEVDPEIITGYNINEFDIPFLFQRAEILRIQGFPLQSRIIDAEVSCAVTTFSSQARGTTNIKTWTFGGRLVVDVMLSLMTSIKLKSYTLNSVSSVLLGDQKEDVHHTMIGKLHQGTPADRARLGSYCIKDTILPIQLIVKKVLIGNDIAIAQVTGIPFPWLVSKGQSIRVMSQLVRACRDLNLLVPHRIRRHGATSPDESMSARFIAPMSDRRSSSKTTPSSPPPPPGSNTPMPSPFVINKRMLAATGKKDARFDDDDSDDDWDDDGEPIEYWDDNHPLGDEHTTPSTAANSTTTASKQASSREASAKAKTTDKAYQGATVLDPRRGFYTEPIPTLDFASLYPSIMRAHNLCYSTLITREYAHAHFKPSDYTITPTGHYFVKSHIFRGVLPRMLDKLIAQRSATRAKQKQAGIDPFLYAALESLQLALKICSNSVYGFTGALLGPLACLAISASVTSFGREMIELVASTIETKYTKANGYEADAVVVYGDTDSVMVKFGVNDVGEAMRLGREACSVCNALFLPPISLEFEKVYYPYLLINKKRYAGQFWTRTDKPDKLDAKGLETVRRDNALIVQNTLKTALNLLMNVKDLQNIQHNVEAAMNHVKLSVSRLLRNEVDLSELVMSKGWSKPREAYDNPNAQFHLVVNEKIVARGGVGYRLGDRIPYIMRSGDKKASKTEWVEDPLYALEHQTPPNIPFYLERLKKSVLRLFEFVTPNAELKMFTGEHMRQRKIVTPSLMESDDYALPDKKLAAASNRLGGILQYARTTKSCLGCNMEMCYVDKQGNQGGYDMCDACAPKVAIHYAKQQAKVNKLEHDFGRLWTHCQSCQGSLHQEVICAANDCPIFYARTARFYDLGRARKRLARFDMAAEYEW